MNELKGTEKSQVKTTTQSREKNMEIYILHYYGLDFNICICKFI